MSDQTTNDKTLKEMIRLGQIIGDPKQVINGIPYAIVPADCKIESLEKFLYSDYADHPHRKKGTVSVLDAQSFIEYYSKFSDEDSRVFADETTATVLGVLDYHGVEVPRWGQHKVQLSLRTHESFSVWMAHDGQAHKMSQMEFAEFIESNAPDIVEPNAATMLEMARDMSAKTDIEFSSAMRTNNGQVQLKYNEQVKGTYGGSNIEIPESFVIQVPVYVGSAPVRLTVRLRYRINGGKISLWYDLLRPKEAIRYAFQASLDVIKENLKVTVINGSPGR